MKKLSVIIPFYNDLENLNCLITNLKKQTYDKEKYDIIIVDDKSDKKLVIEDIKADKNQDIVIYNAEENRGAGVAREIGILISQSQYVCFIDSDDILYNDNVLEMYMREIENNDILVTTFCEEAIVDGKKYLFPRVDDKTWMHGKVYRKKFLEDNKIFFHPSLRYQEDGYFNNICFSSTEKIKNIPLISYVWRSNKKSTTRNNNSEYNFTRFKDYIISTHLTCMELRNRHNNYIINYFCSGVAYIFYYLQLNGWKKYKKEYSECLKLFIDFYKGYELLYDSIDKMDFYQFMNMGRKSVSEKDVFIDKMTFKQFINSNKLQYHKCFNF